MPKEDTQWKKGQSGNPAGRPKKAVCIPDLLKKISDEESGSDMNKLEVVLRVIYKKAVSGDLQCAQFIADRMEGKPRQAMDITSAKETMIVQMDSDE